MDPRAAAPGAGEPCGADQTDPFPGLEYADAKGKFAPVFLLSERAAQERAEKLTGQVPMLAELPARVVLAHIHSAGSTALLLAANGTSIRMPPEALGPLVMGEFTETRPRSEPEEKVRLRAMPPEEVPSKRRQAIRVFCTQRQGAISVHVFNPINPGGRHLQCAGFAGVCPAAG